MKTYLRTSAWVLMLIAIYRFNCAGSEPPRPSSSATPTAVPATGSLAIAPAKDKKVKQSKETGGGKMTNETKQAGSVSKSSSKLVRISAGDDLSVEIPDLDKRAEKDPNVAAHAKLFLDCKEVTGVKSRACLSEKTIIFTLDRDNIQQITAVTKIVSVGVGFRNGAQPEIVMPEKIQLVLITFDCWFYLALGVIIVMAVFLCGAGHWTGLLRDKIASVGVNPTDKAPASVACELGAYSLAKVQMAWWLFFIASAFLFIWLAVGKFDSLTSSTVILFGISMGTAIASRSVSAAKQSTAQDLVAQRDALMKTVGPLRQSLEKAPGAPDTNLMERMQNLTVKQVQLNRTEAKLNQLTKPAAEATSQGFLTDIISDENGISIHRFQMAAWTVVLTIIFVREVWNNLSMPQFSDTLLTLMGISSGTYVALKVPEKHSVVA